GGGGPDPLGGDGDDDSLIGGDGGDRFVFGDLSGSDTIADFDAGAGDRLLVLADGGRLNGGFVGSADDFWARVADVQGGVAVDLGAGNVVLLAGLSAGGLSAAMFEIVT
ncbi:MAG: hypothetical protein AB7P02_24935, partial [Alphaproteobacteria bacterium]